MKLTRTFITLLLIISSLATSKAQTVQKFPENPQEFMKAFGDYLAQSRRPDLVEAFAVFEKSVTLQTVKPEELTRIQLFCNTMRALNLSAHPHFNNYITAVNAVKIDADTMLFDRWHTVAEKTFEKMERTKPKPASTFLEFSNDFLSKRALRMGESGSVTWRLTGGRFSFDYQQGRPILLCDNINLIGQRKEDSIIIKNTSGIYYPIDEAWKGSKGKVTWERVGFDSTIYVALNKYDIDVKKPVYEADSVLLNYPEYFPQGAILGKFNDNITVENKAVASNYPKFESFAKRLTISKIGEGISYLGGFKLNGSSIYGYGTKEVPAELTVFNKKHERVFFGKSTLYVISHGKSVFAESVDANLYMDTDSLYHPNANLRVHIAEQTIDLFRGEKMSDKNPFFSSFYNMNLNADKITWFFDKDSLDIGSRTGVIRGVEQTVEFESSNHFSAGEYSKIQNISSTSPVSVLMLLSKKKDSNIVTDDEFAQQINPKWNYSQVQTILGQLSAQGFINYDFDKHEIELRDKLFHYAMASQEKVDFDYIVLTSKSTQANAQLNLRTKETVVHDIDQIEFSRKQRVAAKIRSGQLTLLRNRDMKFDGTLFAGFTSMLGKSFSFDYNKFNTEFDSLYYLDFFYPTEDKDKYGNFIAKSLNSTMEHVTGVLLIDAPNNKSGKEDLPIFPSLQVTKPAAVFYDKKNLQDTVYIRDSFYYRVFPFPFNSLDKYTVADLKFKGELISANIFPTFKEPIFVREDTSYGFVHKVPDAGYATYLNKGQYSGELDLSNKGLLGKGNLHYLTADIKSENFIFHPKLMTANAKEFFLQEDRGGAVKVPQAKGEEVTIRWLPYRDSMYVTSKEKPFELFKAPGYTHKPTFILTPSGLKGTGEFEWPEGIMTAKLITYGPFQAKSDTADLQIKALDDSKGVTFDTRNVNGELNFDLQIGRFKSNADSASTTLPYDQYKTSMNEFTWDMKGQKVTFKADDAKPGIFQSTDPEQDSLLFTGKTALYDMKTNELKIGGTAYVKSADAYIYPATGEVNILPGGKMGEFENARIIADTLNKYHVINKCKVNILGKKLYQASGYYQYDITGYPQEIYFDNIVGERRGGGLPSEKAVLTTANGEAKEETGFRIDTKTRFKGGINLSANKPNLRFEGFGKLDADQLPGATWFTIYDEIDKNNPKAKITISKNFEGEPLITGFYISKEFSQLYPRILAPAMMRADRQIINCQDYYRYDPKERLFIFGDSLKVLHNSLRGSKMTFDNTTAKVNAEGPLNIGSGLKYMKIKAAGRLDSQFKGEDTDYTVSAEIMTGIELTLPEALLTAMINDIRAGTFDALPPPYNTNLPFYNTALAEYIPIDKDLYESLEFVKLNQISIPKKDAKYTFMFGKHRVKWNTEYQSFVSMEDKMPVIAINGEPISKMLTVFTEYKMPANEDDRYYTYIKANNDLWFFFGYQAGVLSITSSSTKFNDIAAGLKKKDLSYKMPDGETFEIQVVEPLTAERFANRVKEGRN